MREVATAVQEAQELLDKEIMEVMATAHQIQTILVEVVAAQEVLDLMHLQVHKMAEMVVAELHHHYRELQSHMPVAAAVRIFLLEQALTALEVLEVVEMQVILEVQVLSIQEEAAVASAELQD